MLTFFGLSLFSFHFALLSFFVAAFFRLTHFFALLGLVQILFCPLPLAAHNVRIGRSRTHWNSILTEVKCVPRERFIERERLSRALSYSDAHSLTRTCICAITQTETQTHDCFAGCVCVLWGLLALPPGWQI